MFFSLFKTEIPMHFRVTNVGQNPNALSVNKCRTQYIRMHCLVKLILDVIWLKLILDVIWLKLILDVIWLKLILDVIWLKLLLDVIWLKLILDVIWLKANHS